MIIELNNISVGALLFLIAFLGAYANYFFELRKVYGPISRKIMFSECFDLFTICFFGGIIGLGVAKANANDMMTALLSGYTSMSLWEKLGNGSSTAISDKFIVSVHEKSQKESQKELDKFKAYLTKMFDMTEDSKEDSKDNLEEK